MLAPGDSRSPQKTGGWLHPDPFETRNSIAETADVVVIGGGIVGVSAALALAQRGVSTVLCEKGVLGGEQSGRNWGWVRKMGRDPRELPLMIESEHVWQNVSRTPDVDTGYRRKGIVYLCKSGNELENRQRWLNSVSDYGLDSRFLARGELEGVMPGLNGSWAGALYTESDGRAEPQKATTALAKLAQRAGAAIITNCAVRGLEHSAGKLSAVITEHGPIRCSAAVLAGGAWSGLFCRSLDVRLPQLTVRASVTRVDGVQGAPTSAAWGHGFAFRQRTDGGYTVANGLENHADIVPDSFRYLPDFLPILKIEWGHVKLRFGRRFFNELFRSSRWSLSDITPFERLRILNPEPSRSSLSRALEHLKAAFPAFESANETNRWAGLIDATPDALPVISPVHQCPGLFVATGFSGHGFGIGPGAGQLMADLVTNQKPVVDPTPFRLARFSDGTRPQPTTGL
ncbi:MAG: FAD-binding oxidoreductase [Phyllobacteriaceae bacterium]|jgi:glycine/D-amino acid oxidase-like deaminating enzyme|nr:FAD-binding oxidoreductase [Phyllobacteriaceae bacterium]